MCIYVAKNTVKKIADRDIPCIKFLFEKEEEEDIWYSPYRFMLYKLGMLYETEIGEVKTRVSNGMIYSSILEGLHSFSLDGVSSNANLGFYVMCFAFSAIIPKGAEYYEGQFGSDKSYVSNKLIVKGKLCV